MLLYSTVPIEGNYLKQSITLNVLPHRVKSETYFYLCKITSFVDYGNIHERKWMSETFRAEREKEIL
jgi:hypothetical protein